MHRGKVTLDRRIGTTGLRVVADDDHCVGIVIIGTREVVLTEGELRELADAASSAASIVAWPDRKHCGRCDGKGTVLLEYADLLPGGQ